jgi:hypothetical protein
LSGALVLAKWYPFRGSWQDKRLPEKYMANHKKPKGFDEQTGAYHASLLEEIWHKVSSIEYIAVAMTVVLIYGVGGHPIWYAVVLVAVLAVWRISWLRRFGSMAARVLLPVWIGWLCVEIYIVVQNDAALEQFVRLFEFNEKYKEPFYTAVSTLYAIVTALALVKGIEDFDKLKNSIAEEVHRIHSIVDLSTYFEGKNRAYVLELKKSLVKYARNVGQSCDQGMRSPNQQLLLTCQNDIAKLEPEDENDKIALGKMMDERATLSTLRVRRINSVGEKIPNYLLIALWVAAGALILPFLSEPLAIKNASGQVVENPALFSQYYMIFLMATLNSFLLLMLSDIADPFDGFWNVDRQAFNDLADELEAEIECEEAGE